jgi:hypothetical protein
VSPPERVATCDGDIQTATSSEFFLINRLKTRNFIWAELNVLGVVVFWIENLPRDGTGCPGWWMFDQMMAHFAPRVVAIKGSWTFGDNLETVNVLTGSGVPIEIAATRGPTGRYASAHGYSRVTLLSSVGVHGAYTHVSVLFER